MSLASNRRSQLRAVGVGVGVGLAGIVVAFVLVVLAGFVMAALGIEMTPLVLIGVSLALGQGVAFMGVGYGYLRWRGLPLRSVGLRVPSIVELAIGAGVFGVSIAYLMAVGIILQQTQTESANNEVANLAMQNPEVALLLIPAAYLLIGPGEELLYRGVVQGRIRETMSAVPAIFIASVIFAGIHMMALQADAPLTAKLTTIVILMGPSLAFGAVYEYTENLVIPILLHGTYDAFLFAILYLVASGSMPMEGQEAVLLTTLF